MRSVHQPWLSSGGKQDLSLNYACLCLKEMVRGI